MHDTVFDSDQAFDEVSDKLYMGIKYFHIMTSFYKTVVAKRERLSAHAYWCDEAFKHMVSAYKCIIESKAACRDYSEPQAAETLKQAFSLIQDFIRQSNLIVMDSNYEVSGTSLERIISLATQLQSEAFDLLAVALEELYEASLKLEDGRSTSVQDFYRNLARDAHANPGFLPEILHKSVGGPSSEQEKDKVCGRCNIYAGRFLDKHTDSCS
ncbi:MAG: hypothetical protein LBC41_14885 [Clostridiales bacterium]|jgi:hypothetical protein|nr:hypothetical protein [Clostridiales bacterium]